jgi:hypothetical protein
MPHTRHTSPGLVTGAHEVVRTTSPTSDATVGQKTRSKMSPMPSAKLTDASDSTKQKAAKLCSREARNIKIGDSTLGDSKSAPPPSGSEAPARRRSSNGQARRDAAAARCEAGQDRIAARAAKTRNLARRKRDRLVRKLRKARAKRERLFQRLITLETRAERRAFRVRERSPTELRREARAAQREREWEVEREALMKRIAARCAAEVVDAEVVDNDLA